MADATTPYSFIDVAAWDGVRENFLSGLPMAVFSQDMQSLLWANGRAAQLFGYAAIGEFEDEGPSGMGTALRQIVTAAARCGPGDEVVTHIRIASGAKSRVLPARVRRITGRDGALCIMLVVDSVEGGAGEGDAALSAIAGLAGEGAGAAIVDANGGLLAADELFSGISFPAGAINALVRDVREEKDRLVKRLISPGPTVPVAVAIARLTDTPLRHLVMAVRSGEQAGETRAEPETDAAPVPALPEVAGPEREPSPTETHEDATAGIEAPMEPVAVADGPESEEPSEADAHEEPVTEQVAEVEDQPEAAAFEPEAAPEPAEASADDGGTAQPDTETEFEPDFDVVRGPVRFVWKTDRDSRFTDISAEFAAAVGPRAADVVGRSFEDVSRAYDLDPSGEISASLKRHDTWSGKSVLWPVEGTEYRVPVDLAALPSYNRDREFEGYRGFGIVRMGERKPDPGKLGIALAELPEEPVAPTPEPVDAPEAAQTPAAPRDPFAGEIPVMTTSAPTPMRRESDKVINLDSKRRSHAAGETLNPSEQAAFRQIGDVLGWARVKKDEPPENTSEREAPAAFRGEHVSEEAPTPEAPVVDEPDYIATVEEDAGLESVFGFGDLDEALVETDDNLAGDNDDDRDAWDEWDDDTPGDHDETDELALFSDGTDAEDDQGRDVRESGLTPGFLDALPLPVLIHRDDEALFANKAFVEMSGYRDADSLNETGGIDALFEGEASRDGALSLRTAEGGSVSARAHMQTVPWQGRTALMFAFEPRRHLDAEPHTGESGEDTQASEAAELRAILDTASDGVVVLSRDGVIRSLNASASALFGYAGDEIEGKSFAVLFAHESQAAALDYLSGLADNGVASVLNEGLEVLGREKNGGFLPLFMTIGRLETSDGFCAVVRDITAWKQTEQALRDAQRNAEQASSHKTEFLAKISHEIRTPLNAIIGFSELMAEERFGPIGNERYKSYLADINKSGKYVLDLVNDLLDISKIEAGKQEMEFESVALNDAVAEATSMILPQANRNRVIIRSSLDEELPEVVADARSVKQIVINLLSNAVRFTHSGGQVIVNTSYNARGEVVLRIKDTGIGMSAKEIEMAFQPFQQVASLGRARGDGTGLGLPLTKALVEANRAEFAIQSEPGKGTAVEVVFPPSRVLAS